MGVNLSLIMRVILIARGMFQSSSTYHYIEAFRSEMIKQFFSWQNYIDKLS